MGATWRSPAGRPPYVRTWRNCCRLLQGRIQPGRVFFRVITLDAVPDGYRAMNEREAIKVTITF